jgi:hypothetical protein
MDFYTFRKNKLYHSQTKINNIMPNWCENTLTISLLEDTKKSRKQLKDFIEVAQGKDTDIDFQKLFPMPEELAKVSTPVTLVADKDYEKIHKKEVAEYAKRKKANPDYDSETYSISESMSKELKRKYQTDNWYDWRVQNWGIKWSVEAKKIDNTETFASYYFNSPWTTPIDFFVKISENYPLLNFSLEYDEPGNCFKGTAEISNGEYSDDREEYVPENDEEEDEE